MTALHPGTLREKILLRICVHARYEKAENTAEMKRTKKKTTVEDKELCRLENCRNLHVPPTEETIGQHMQLRKHTKSQNMHTHNNHSGKERQK